MKYGIICAMEEEIKSLVAQLEDKKQDTIGGIDFLVVRSTEKK